MKLLAALALTALLSHPATAQTQTTSSRASALNREGNWQEAATLVSTALSSATSPAGDPERCRMQVSLSYSLLRVSQPDSSQRVLAAYDRQCVYDGVSVVPDMEQFVASFRPELMKATASRSTLRPLPRATAASLGLSPALLEQHATICQRTRAEACMVVYRGNVVQEWYDTTAPRPRAAMSSTKSVTALLVGMLIEDGRIRSLDDRVCDYIDTWCDGIRGDVTLQHLMSMTAGLPLMGPAGIASARDKNAFVTSLTPKVKPGSRWIYSNESAQLLSPILDKAAGEPIQDYAARRLFGPLGLGATRLRVYPSGVAWTYGDMETTAEDLAIIGQTVLQGGVMNGTRIVSADWIRRITTTSQLGQPQYGLMWWIQNQPAGFVARGYLDTNVYVFPSRELVVVRMQNRPGPGPEDGSYERDAMPLFQAIIPK